MLYLPHRIQDGGVVLIAEPTNLRQVVTDLFVGDKEEHMTRLGNVWPAPVTQ